MKNKFIALALVTLSIATTTVSCTKDDSPLTSKAQNVETTNVEFGVSADNKVASATGRMVDKSIVPLYVDNLTIWAKSNITGIAPIHENFTFGTAGAGVLSGFSLNGVALGSNTFQAESWASESNAKLSLGNVILANSGDDVLTTMKAHVPYIRTYSNQPTVTIVKGTNAKVNLTMSTDYGRVLAKFVQESDVNKYLVKVSATVPTGDFDANSGMPTFTILPETVITPTTGFEWSNMASTFMTKAVFTIKIYDKVSGTLLNTITKEVAVSRATTSLATFTIHNTDVVTDIEQGGIVLTFPTIGEEVINN